MLPAWLSSSFVAGLSFSDGGSSFGGGFRFFDELEQELLPGDFFFSAEFDSDESRVLVPGFVLGSQIANKTAVIHCVMCWEGVTPIIRSLNYFPFEWQKFSKSSGYGFAAKSKNMIRASSFEFQMHRENYRQLIHRWIEYKDFIGKI